MEHKDFKFVFDTETSGLWPRQKEKAGLQEPQFQLTEVAIIVLDWGLQEVERYQSYIKPYNENTSWNAEAQKLTGISKELCIEKGKDLKEVVGSIKSLGEKYKNGRYVYPQLVAYNTPFDLDFLTLAFDLVYGNGYRQENSKSYLYKSLFNPISIDVLGMIRDKYGDNKEPLINFKLGTVAEYLGIQANGSLHGAMVDTEILVGLYRYLMSAQRGNAGSVNAIKQTKNLFQF